jgi:lipopolysaccharide/colanic/teichoic acid biosynthesis glycosyltransferase
MYYSVVKPFADRLFALLAICLLSPLIIIVSILLIYINKSSGVFFLQKRVGKNNKVFKVIKFKSMTDERDQSGDLLPNEKRLTSFGNFIRKTSLDELPQLFNVLIGDMSFIGPRPLPVRYLNLYNEIQSKRHQIKPGITGWAQVNGRNNISWTKKFELDVWYVSNVSMQLDMKIFLMTINSIIRKTNIDSLDKGVGGVGFDGKN